MKRFLTIILLFAATLSGAARPFGDSFDGRTLRLDYVLCGDASHQAIYLQQASIGGEWAGRRSCLEAPLVEGNAQIRLSSLGGEVLYVQSFSNLFLEWLTYEEATRVPRAFECPVYVPMPREKVRIDVVLLNTHREVSASLVHELDPADILIRPLADNGLPREVLHRGGPLDKACDIVFVSEGYREAEKAKFFADARRMMKELFQTEPYTSRMDRFNIRAVFQPSAQSGVSQPGLGDWRSTAASSHFNTFYMDRYLTSSSLRAVYDIIGTTPAEIIILLANTNRYGGGGILNNITLVTADEATSGIVFVHEFGHAFAGLADEYDYGEEVDPFYPAGIEPWEPNITTLTDFASKWADLVDPAAPVPTEPDDVEKRGNVRRIWNTLSEKERKSLNLKVGIYEGAGYQKKGVYRPVQECRMRMNECEEFCPVCKRAIIRMIDFLTEGE